MSVSVLLEVGPDYLLLRAHLTPYRFCVVKLVMNLEFKNDYKVNIVNFSDEWLEIKPHGSILKSRLLLGRIIGVLNPALIQFITKDRGAGLEEAPDPVNEEENTDA